MKSVRALIPLAVLAIGGIFTTQARADDAAVKTQLQSVFQRYVNAMKKRDVNTALSIYTADYTSKAPNGRIETYAQVAAGMKRNIQNVTLQRGGFNIRKLTVHGNQAIAEGTVSFDFAVIDTLGRMGPKGKTHTFASTAEERDTFVKTVQGWKIKFAETLSGSRTRDGKKLGP